MHKLAALILSYPLFGAKKDTTFSGLKEPS
jgi:hypothetical protein